jgi:hypothetical protein
LGNRQDGGHVIAYRGLIAALGDRKTQNGAETHTAYFLAIGEDGYDEVPKTVLQSFGVHAQANP